jgi:hypothetical protein
MYYCLYFDAQTQKNKKVFDKNLENIKKILGENKLLELFYSTTLKKDDFLSMKTENIEDYLGI